MVSPEFNLGSKFLTVVNAQEHAHDPAEYRQKSLQIREAETALGESNVKRQA